MNAAIVIPRKDARLAATVVVPAVIIAGGMALVCAFGHLLPGGSDLLWSGAGGVPTMAVRMQPVVPLLAIASYIVPCWCAVLVALGDASRHGDLLAAAVPVRDSSKAVSKLAAMLAVAILVCAALALVARVATGDGALILMHQFSWMAKFGPLLAGLGVLSGLASVSLVRRAVPALIVATVLPIGGIALCVPGAFVLVSPWITDSEVIPPLRYGVSAGEFAWARWQAVMYGALAANGIMLGSLAWRSVPVLAGRTPHGSLLRTGAWSIGSALVVSAGIAASVNAWDPQLQASRANGRWELQARRDASVVSDAQLIECVTSWPYRTDFQRQIADGRDPYDTVFAALRERGPVADTPGLWEMRIWQEALHAELRTRLRSATTATRGEIERAVFDDRSDVLARLRLAELYAARTSRPLWAEMLARVKSEEDQVAITAALAYAANCRFPFEMDGMPGDWPTLVAQAARGLEAGLRMSTSAAERTQLERALLALGRPLPDLANRPQRTGRSSPSNQWFRLNLDALRNGVDHRKSGAAK